MPPNDNADKQSRAPLWSDWVYSSGAAIAAIVVLVACFGWWSAHTAGRHARAAAVERLDSIAHTVVAFAGNEAVDRPAVDALLAKIREQEHLVTAERLETGSAPEHANPSLVSAAIPLPRDLGAVHVVATVGPTPWYAGLLLPAATATGLIIAVGIVGVTTTRRTAGLRRVGSALRAVSEGETDRDVLLVAPRFGPDAAAWNSLVTSLSERELTPAEAVQNRRDNSAQAGTLPNGALDAMPFGLIALDDTSTVMFCNGAAAAMLGVQRADLVGQPAIDSPAFADLADAIQTVSIGGTPRTSFDLSRGDEGRRDVFRVTVRALRKDDDATTLIIIEDVTQTRLADEARNGFVAQATHELRTPLTNIRLIVEEAIETGLGETPALAKTLNIVNHEARRLDRVVADMLSVSEIEAATLTLNIDDTPVAKIFQDLEMDYRAQAEEKSIRLSFDLPAKVETIRADREKVALLLHNVLGNAIKYTPAGGAVDFSAEQDETWLTVRVKDNGPGIAKDDHERVFQKFYRTDAARTSDTKGSGLGLALAREVARRHGGEIELESEVGVGSTFIVRIPRGDSAAVSKAA